MRFKEWILTESKQDIVSLGFPEVVASLMQESFGKNAFLIARWFKEYQHSGWMEAHKDWWHERMGDFRNTPSFADLTDMYAATTDEESYKKVLDRLELSRSDDDFYDLPEQRIALKEQIKAHLFDNIFFKVMGIVQDIMSNKLTDLSTYKKLSNNDAQEKYDKKNIFQDRDPIKTYPSGFKWVDAGKRCQLVGSLMKNCGSAGLMSSDKDKTILALFDKLNKPHILVTYSPNEHRISGDQGIGSSEPKEKYHDYILDIAKHLGATFDAEKSKSTMLRMKSIFGPDAQVQRVGKRDVYNQFFKFFKQC